MSKESLLLVDGDTRSLRVLEVSLRKAGFSVTPAVSVGDALDKLEINAPDLIICETTFSTELDGFELRRRLRASPDWADIPFIFLTAETAIENKIKGLELGVDDYLTKPIYIKEIVTRINILLQKRQRQFLDLKKDGTRFAGRVADMPVVDVIQTIEVSRKSGVIQFLGGASRQAAIYFRDGKVIDAEAGTLQGEDAVYRLLTWNEGEFEVEFRTVRRREAISTSSQGLLMEGMRRLDEWSRLLEQLPPLAHRFEIDAGELTTRLGEIPDDNNRILRLFDGRRTLMEVIDASDFGDLECLQAISRLYFEGLLIDLDPGQRTKRDTGKPMPLTLVEGVPTTPIEEVISGPIDIVGLSARVPPVTEISDISERPSVRSVEAQDSTAAPAAPVEAPVPVETPVPVEARAPVEVPMRARRESGVLVDELDVVGEEEDLRAPLTGAYRPSSLRLIDEAVAAAQLIEPSLFSPDELAAAGVAPVPAAPQQEPETAFARIKTTRAATDPRIENARDLVERSPAFDSGTNGDGARRKTASVPPPIPAKARITATEAAEAPLLDADLYTSGERSIKSEDELAPFVDADPYTSGEIAVPPEDYSGVPTVVEAADEGTDPSRRRFANTVRRDDGMRMIGSLGRDRAEASGELRAPPSRNAPADANEAQRELVTIMPRRITRDIPIQPLPTAKVETSLAIEEEPAPPAPPAAKAEAKPAKPAVEPPPRPVPRTVTVEGGVVRKSGPGVGAKILIGVATVLAGATVYSYCKSNKAPPQQQVVVPADADAVVVAPQDAAELGGFGIDAAVAVAPRRDASVAGMQRSDAAVAVARRPDAAIAVVRPDAGMVATGTHDAGEVAPDKNKEARALFDKAHEALEDGDPELALELLDQSIRLRKTARSYLERARALQRLNRIDDAVAAVDEAIKMNASFPPAYEQKGMILWSAQRYGDARPALQKYLELEPDGKSAPKIRAMLDESK